ncbi:MAG: alpha-hydroxy-acid oxidizing protein [Acidobacteria bacterium]|nr:alpha-hydroxy-acid oxidizing protein [Acidobacteriota bacterium]
MAITRRKALLSAGSVLAGAALDLPKTTAAPQADLPASTVSLGDFELLARERMTAMAWEYISGGAGDELTLRWNREAYDRIKLKPRVLVDVSRLDTRVNLFGRELPLPILLAPAAYQKLVHADGELATAKGAGAAIMVVSTMASVSIEDIAATTKQPPWFQLYVQPDRGFTKALVQRAEAAGCQALVVTVDTPIPGLRNREERIKFALPPGIERPNLKGLSTAGSSHLPKENEIYNALFDARLTWKDVEWLRSLTKLPVLLKGVLNPDDADLAVKSGAAGVIVSNHGSRNIDTLPATIEALPAVAAKIAGRIPVLVDGGIRRGTDVLKALALGAKAVLIGRPYLYGLGVGGADGVNRVVGILRREFEMAMALTGRTSIAELGESALWQSQQEKNR